MEGLRSLSVPGFHESLGLRPGEGSETVRTSDLAGAEVLLRDLKPVMSPMQRFLSGARDDPTIESVAGVALVHVGPFGIANSTPGILDLQRFLGRGLSCS